MAEKSGPQWCKRFPTSTALEDMVEQFAERTQAFISQLNRAGAKTTVSATYRPPERAYLMHWAWAVSRGLPSSMCRPGDRPGVPVPPASVPPMPGVAIDWTHGANSTAARAAATAMVAQYAMKYCAALKSRHTERRAVDMTISWQGTLKITDFNGQSQSITSEPRNGTNPALAKVGRTYGVMKLVGDDPHWSDDGH